jgi:hypothetical protein
MINYWKTNIFPNLYKNRFELFFFVQLLILFGPLIFSNPFHENILMNILFLVNIISGMVLISKKKLFKTLFVVLFSGMFILFLLNLIKGGEREGLSFIRFGVYFLFYISVTIEVITQVWNAKTVNKNVIVGLMSGYVSIGLLAFFVFSSIELSTPDSFKGLLVEGVEFSSKIDALLYYSYITVLTIGFGDIVPVTMIAQKATVFVGLCGQFYIVIITAVVVQKFMQNNDGKESTE